MTETRNRTLAEVRAWIKVFAPEIISKFDSRFLINDDEIIKKGRITGDLTNLLDHRYQELGYHLVYENGQIYLMYPNKIDFLEFSLGNSMTDINTVIENLERGKNDSH